MIIKLLLVLSSDIILVAVFLICFILNFFGYVLDSSLLYLLLRLLVLSLIFKLLYNFVSTTLIINDVKKKKKNNNG
jgi:hypothetical protein